MEMNDKYPAFPNIGLFLSWQVKECYVLFLMAL